MAEGKKRYSIVRVDIKCPIGIEEDISEIDRIKMFDCIGKRQCGDCPYGDTKEQLIKKVAQVLLREKLEWYRENLDIMPKGKIDEPLVRNLYEHCLDKAKKIVEFLGVK